MSDQDNEKCRKCAGSNADKTSDRMVQCDNCDKWYHFECVGVNSDIANVSWNCEFCESTTASTVMSAAAPSTPLIDYHAPSQISRVPQSSSSPTQALLSQQYSMVPQFCEPTTPSTAMGAAAPSTTLIEHHAQTQISRMSQSSSPKQLQLPSQQYSTVPVFSTESVTVVPPPPELVHEWKTAGALVYPSSALTVAANAHAQPLSIFTQPISSYRPQSSNVNGNAQPVSDLRYQSTSCAGNTSVGYQMPFGSKLSAFPHCTTSLPAHPNPYELHMSNPTPAQLAARQAIPKDLPHFSGDPEEWPIFISSFDNSTTIAGYSQVENLIRLQRCLKGKAREMVKHKLLLPGMVPEIIRTLKMCFGRPEHILDRVLEKVRRLPHPKDRLESLIEFALCVSDICSTMEACQMEAHLHNPMLVRELMDKLPNQYKLSWAMYEKTDSIPVVKAFSNWIYQLAEAASSVVPAVSMTNRKSASLNTHTQVDNMQPRKVQCTICGDSHKIWQCDQFKSFTTSQKWEAVKTNKLCRLCLNIHRRKCFISNECGIDGCNAKHHQLLHNHKIRANDDMAGSNISKQFRGAVVSAHSDVNEYEKVYFRIIPIKIHTSKGSVNSFAFLDEGSSVTLMDEDMYNTLGLKGDKDPLCLRWTSNTTRIEETSHRVFVEISDNENHVHYKLQNVHTVRKLGLPTQTVNMGDIRRKYEHLREIPVESYENAKPAILIGADNWNLAVPLKIREGASNQPIAVKCRLGWALQGGYSSQQAHQLNIHSCECDYERRLNELHDAVKQQFQLETSTPVKLQSKEDLRATNILQDTCQMKDGHFEVGLLWRQDDTKLPVSYMTAYKRLMCLQRKFMRDPELKHSFQEQIDNLVTKGYARKLAPEELTTDPDRTWYLPIFTTLNLNKPGKVRLVWDAAAKSNGCSLNDFILSGPDLLNSLVDILLAFRTGQVAICGDIAEMFHQINVHPDDMHAQRFLWLNENDDLHHPSVYVMRALTFGISCAPCIAHFVRDKNAEQFKEKYPRAVESIQHYHYVDDLIDTVDDEEEAIELAKQVRQIHANAGFNIRNWTSNRETVVSPLCNEATVAQPIMELSSTEKVLGMYWDPNKDVFKYIFRFARLNRDVFAADTIVTKRETLASSNVNIRSIRLVVLLYDWAENPPSRNLAFRDWLGRRTFDRSGSEVVSVESIYVNDIIRHNSAMLLIPPEGQL